MLSFGVSEICDCFFVLKVSNLHSSRANIHTSPEVDFSITYYISSLYPCLAKPPKSESRSGSPITLSRLTQNLQSYHSLLSTTMSSPFSTSDRLRPESPDSEVNSLASLPDSAESDSIEESTDDGEGRLVDAEREWKESLQQLELLLTLVVVPYMGKYFGRKCAFWCEFLSSMFGSG